MSRSGDTPKQGLVDPFFACHGYPPSTLEERAEFEAFWAQCQADWRVEIAEGLGEFAPDDAPEQVGPEPVNLKSVSPIADRPVLIDGPPIPISLDLTEVFAAVPPEHLFDGDLREEILYAEYLAANFLPNEGATDEL
ncbi:hypothetical protein [Cryobacterium aureum]|uniref:hypothetical protein n=1 Tax=Cryobacterium aureum TaxID=995037 RepID=UPI000CF49C09|nr:hypothetical protein [Cryobacterium aureum]